MNAVVLVGIHGIKDFLGHLSLFGVVLFLNKVHDILKSHRVLVTKRIKILSLEDFRYIKTNTPAGTCDIAASQWMSTFDRDLSSLLGHAIRFFLVSVLIS